MQDGPLGWLPSAQQSYAIGLDLWDPLEQRLTGALANLREGSFLICEVPGPQTEAGERGTKYLQFALMEGEQGRRLTAQASALKYQGVTDPAGQAQQALIDAMGWTRPDDDNHQRVFSWPLDVHDAVGQSLRILRDVWGVTHPSLIRIGEPAAFGHEPLSAADDIQTLHTTLASWVELVGGSSKPLSGSTEVLFCSVAEALVSLRPIPDEGRLDLEGLVGVVRGADSHAAVIMRVVAEEALIGCVRLSPMDEGKELLELNESLRLDGLTLDSFAQQLLWLAGSCVTVESRLGSAGILEDLGAGE